MNQILIQINDCESLSSHDNVHDVTKNQQVNGKEQAVVCQDEKIGVIFFLWLFNYK